MRKFVTILLLACIGSTGWLFAATPSSDFSCDIQVVFVDVFTDKVIPDVVASISKTQGSKRSSDTSRMVDNESLQVSFDGVSRISVNPSTSTHEPGGLVIDSHMIDSLVLDKSPHLVVYGQSLAVDLSKRKLTGSVKVPLRPRISWQSFVPEIHAHATTEFASLDKETYVCGYTMNFSAAATKKAGAAQTEAEVDSLSLVAMAPTRAVDLARDTKLLAEGDFILVVNKETTVLHAGKGFMFLAGVPNQYNMIDGRTAPADGYANTCQWPTALLVQKQVGDNEYSFPYVLFCKDSQDRFGKLVMTGLNLKSPRHLSTRIAVNCEPGDNRFRVMN